MKLIYGTTNKGKLNQVKEYLEYKKANIELLSLQDINFNEDVEENGTN